MLKDFLQQQAKGIPKSITLDKGVYICRHMKINVIFQSINLSTRTNNL